MDAWCPIKILNPGGDMKKITVPFVITFFTLISLFVFFGISSVEAQEKESCVSAKCHIKMGKDKFVHGPAAVGACVSCHTPISKHKFVPITNVGALCYKCHDRVDTKKSLHKPVKDGTCTKCHDAHQSNFKFQLRGDGKDLCLKCHDRKLVSGKFVHGPVAVGGCSMCHNSHQADFPKLLNAAGNNACFQCHTDKAEAFKGKKFVHKPVKESCASCHSPHAGDFKYMLKKDGLEDLCFDCHADKKAWLAKIKVKHGGLETDKKCMACHEPHASDYVKNLYRQPIESCNMCHDKPLDTQDGKIIDMKENLAKNKYYHGPIKQGDCSGCHNTHGSDYYRILRKYFPPVFYAPYNLKNYELCFNCHEKTIVQDPKTTTLTAFRNGDQNLHFVHVNKEVKGRTCRACHDAHATNNPKHIRDTVPFGAWGLPVGFSKDKNGGSCLPGCHQKFDYDRIKAVKNR